MGICRPKNQLAAGHHVAQLQGIRVVVDSGSHESVVMMLRGKKVR